PPSSITRFRCAGRVDRPKGNPVRFAVSVACQIRSCPRNCRRRVLLQFATGLCTQGLGRRRRTMTREPGDLPGHVILPACGARASGRSSAVVTGELSSGWGRPPMRCRVQPVQFVGLAAITKVARVRWSAAFLAAAPAMAAEMAVKAPWQAPIVQTYDWTGLYVGAHLGYAWGHSNWSAPPDLSSSLDLDQSSDIFTGAGSYFGG